MQCVKMYSLDDFCFVCVVLKGREGLFTFSVLREDSGNPEVKFGCCVLVDCPAKIKVFFYAGIMSVGFIGAGQAAQALVRGFAAAGEFRVTPGILV